MTMFSCAAILNEYLQIKKEFQEKDNYQVATTIAGKLGAYSSQFELIFRFLIDAFENKKRFDHKTPLVFHSIFLVHILHACGEHNVKTLLTASLHDILEDTPVTEGELNDFIQSLHFLDTDVSTEEIIENIKILTENKQLSREPVPKALPERYQEHISRIMGSRKEVINVEIVDRFCDLMDLEYILELPEEKKKARLESKMIKVKSFVENITRNRHDFNSCCLELFNYQLKLVESEHQLNEKAVFIGPTEEINMTSTNNSDYFPESTLIDTIDGIQCKVYANSHPHGLVIVKPKYVPEELIEFTGMKKRFLFEKCMTRFNFFNDKEIVKENLKRLRAKFPWFVYTCPQHQNWFLVVPRDQIKKYYSPQEGLRQLMKVPESDLDPYLKAVRGLINLIVESGVTIGNLGISHSTLLGNYTPGKSDIDLLVFGKSNGWKVIHHMEQAKHPLLRWKSEEDWAKYYRDRVVSKQYSEKEYVYNMVRKRDDGFFDGNVFSIFVIEKEDELWYDWEEKHSPLATVKVRGTVTDAAHSHIRPGYYELSNTEIVEGYTAVPIQRIVTWSRPFLLQARKGDRVESVGLLEKVKPKYGPEYFQVVLGYSDTYTSDRGEQEYLKTLVN